MHCRPDAVTRITVALSMSPALPISGSVSTDAGGHGRLSTSSSSSQRAHVEVVDGHVAEEPPERAM